MPHVGLVDLGVTCSPRDPRFADSNPAEVNDERPTGKKTTSKWEDGGKIGNTNKYRNSNVKLVFIVLKKRILNIKIQGK